jgi:hypothetical protein
MAFDTRAAGVGVGAPTPTPYIPGRFYDSAWYAAAATTSAGAAGRVELVPFCTNRDLVIDRIGVAVSTLVSSALAKCAIYGSDASGWPFDLLLEPVGDLDCSTTGAKMHTVNFEFGASRLYWLAVRHSSTATLRAIPLSGAPQCGLQSDSATAYNTVIRRTLAYVAPLPAVWGFLASELVSATPTSIRVRAA